MELQKSPLIATRRESDSKDIASQLPSSSGVDICGIDQLRKHGYEPKI
jgi:hypothetical protein